jgi:hypothetical protein
MIIDLNKLNLRESSKKKYHQQWAPPGKELAWPHALDCGHTHLLKAAEIDAVPKQGSAIYCSKCAEGNRTGFGDEGFCTRTVYHKPVVIGLPVLVDITQPQEQQQQEQGTK